MNSVDFDEKGREVPEFKVVLALLDCSKAFDRMFRPLLFRKLRDCGVRGRLFTFLVAYFASRRQRVRVGTYFSDYVETILGGPQGSVIILFCWLLYINDITLCMRESGNALFVDDVGLWLHSSSGEDLVARLNSELQRIYNWSCINQMVFDFKKFHLFDLGNRIHSSFRDTVCFGDGSPGWELSARYLGVIIDRDLYFVPMLEKVFERFSASSWRVFNHANVVTGAAPRTLEIIFLSWLYPILEYGSAVWIFRIKDVLHFSYPVKSRYSNVFGRLSKLYLRLARAILGVDSITSGLATLVRLGWMPIDYLLAYRACICYMKVRHQNET